MRGMIIRDAATLFGLGLNKRTQRSPCSPQPYLFYVTDEKVVHVDKIDAPGKWMNINDIRGQREYTWTNEAAARRLKCLQFQEGVPGH